MGGQAPLGPQKLDLAGMPDGAFEEMCHRLVLLDHPDALATAIPDSGADSILPDGAGGFERAWQAKRYGGHIHWGKCRDGLDRAVATYAIRHMRFFFARDLSDGQLLAFPKHLVGRHDGVTVDYRGKSEICAGLDGSDEGRRIARHYFGPDQNEREELIARVARAQGPLKTVGDALERRRPVGEFLQGHDPFFAYPSASYEDGCAVPGHPGAVMSVISSEGGHNERVEAVPRDDAAIARYGPEITVGFTDDAAGRKAGAAFHKALRENTEFEGEEGIAVIFKRLPPAFADEVGRVTKGRVQITPLKPVPAPWVGEVTATSDRWEETLTFDLKPIEPPEGWDFAFGAVYAGVGLTVLAARRRDRGEQTLRWRHEASTAPATEQAQAMRFLAALHGPGEFVLRNLALPEAEMRQPLEADEIDHLTLGLLQVFEEVVQIETWSGTTISIPEEFSGRDAHDVAVAAASVRAGELRVTLSDATFDVYPEGVSQLAKRPAVKVVQQLGVRVLGQEVPLGEGELILPPYDFEEIGAGEAEGTRRVTLRPVGGPAKVAYKLTPPRDESVAVAA